jgi:hypothetical protein
MLGARPEASAPSTNSTSTGDPPAGWNSIARVAEVRSLRATAAVDQGLAKERQRVAGERPDRHPRRGRRRSDVPTATRERGRERRGQDEQVPARVDPGRGGDQGGDQDEDAAPATGSARSGQRSGRSSDANGEEEGPPERSARARPGRLRRHEEAQEPRLGAAQGPPGRESRRGTVRSRRRRRGRARPCRWRGGDRRARRATRWLSIVTSGRRTRTVPALPETALPAWRSASSVGRKPCRRSARGSGRGRRGRASARPGAPAGRRFLRAGSTRAQASRLPVVKSNVAGLAGRGHLSTTGRGALEWPGP